MKWFQVRTREFKISLYAQTRVLFGKKVLNTLQNKSLCNSLQVPLKPIPKHRIFGMSKKYIWRTIFNNNLEIQLVSWMIKTYRNRSFWMKYFPFSWSKLEWNRIHREIIFKTTGMTERIARIVLPGVPTIVCIPLSRIIVWYHP